MNWNWLAALVRPVRSQAAPGHRQYRPQLDALEERVALARNILIFVADGLRASAVNATDAPTMFALQQAGVNFANSHAMFPTFTTPNAAAIATGHYPGDTGDFSNTVFVNYPVVPAGNSPTPFIENDAVLGDIDEHFPGANFLGEETLLAYARQNGYDTAAVGKHGPTLIQDVTQGNPVNGTVPVPQTVILDDVTGQAIGVPLSQAIQNALTAAGLPLATPGRGANGASGNNTTPGTTVANVTQQQFFADAVTKAILPTFQADGKPFALVFWSRDPDGTQHNQGDSLNSLTPGINGPTSKAAIHNADNNLAQIINYLNATGQLANTDIFVTADHGFSTISRHDLDNTGTHFTTSYAAGFTYRDTTGRQEVNTGFLPPGFVAIDIAHALNLPLFDADSTVTSAGKLVYKPVDPAAAQATATVNQHPRNGDGLIGGTGQVLSVPDAKVIVAANGGSDLVYVPYTRFTKATATQTVKQIVQFLVRQDYVSGVFVNDAFGTIPGALPMSSINLHGSASLPQPSIVINFRTFALDPNNALLTQISIADTGLQQGQGMHGSFGRGDTNNIMIASGPDFKAGFTDTAPVSNADIVPTLTRAIGVTLPARGSLTGRAATEALVGGSAVTVTSGTTRSTVDPVSGQQTILNWQQVGGTTYFDAAGFLGRTTGLSG